MPRRMVPAQAQPGGAGQAQPAPTASTSNVNLAPGLFDADNLLKMGNEVFDPDADSLDLEEGTFTWKGRVFTLGQDRVFRARFERYLSLPRPPEGAQEYKALLDAIFEELQGTGSSRGVTVDSPAWGLLFQAADYTELDDGNSLVVANQVSNAMRVRNESRSGRIDSSELEQVRRAQQEIVANRERVLADLHERRQRMVALNQTTGEEFGGAGYSAEAQFRAQDLAETEARLAALETQRAGTGIEAKLQFQSQILGFFLQRRFPHAMMASGFYRQMFKGSQQALEVGDAEMRKFLPDTDLSFTVDTIDFISREAVADVNLGMQVVDSAFERGDRIQALQRLQETFVLGEHLPSVYLYPEEKRLHLLELYMLMREAQDLMEVRDWVAVEDVVAEIETLTEDFSGRRITSMINNAKSMSNLAVFAAKEFLNLNDIAAAREELQKAVEIWPMNPNILRFQEQSSRGAQGEIAFADMVERQDWRAIFERRVELGQALDPNSPEAQQLMEIIKRVSELEILVTQAEEMARQDQPYAAWELLVQASELSEEDPVLNRAQARLAPRVAEFVGRLDRARRAEEAENDPVALAAYLNAQQAYPLSRLSRLGIDRVSTRIMDRLSETQTEAEPAEPAVSATQPAPLPETVAE